MINWYLLRGDSGYISFFFFASFGVFLILFICSSISTWLGQISECWHKHLHVYTPMFFFFYILHIYFSLFYFIVELHFPHFPPLFSHILPTPPPTFNPPPTLLSLSMGLLSKFLDNCSPFFPVIALPSAYSQFVLYFHVSGSMLLTCLFCY